MPFNLNELALNGKINNTYCSPLLNAFKMPRAVFNYAFSRVLGFATVESGPHEPTRERRGPLPLGT